MKKIETRYGLGDNKIYEGEVENGVRHGYGKSYYEPYEYLGEEPLWYE